MDRLVPALLIAAIVTIVSAVCYAVYQDAVWWDQYSREHHCAVTGAEDSYVVMQPIYSSDAKGNMYVSSMIPIVIVRKQYRCDGGELRWRG
jgi:hypothetical protein